MRHNDNEFDQLFRDRLRDHASPVRADLWRRIQTSIGRRSSRTPYWPLFAAIPAACLIMFIVNPHILHNPSAMGHPSAPTRLSIPDHPSAADHLSAPTRQSAASPTANHPSTTATAPAITPSSPTTAAPVSHYSSISNRSSRSSANPEPATNLVPSAASVQTALATPRPDHTPSTPDHTPSTLEHPDHRTSTPTHPNPTLPSLAPFAARGTIPECPLTPRSRFKPSLDAGTGPDFYLSAIGGINFPVLYYHNSYTIGIRLTAQITPHWSVTSGLQYSWANFGKENDSLSFYYPRTFRNLAIPILIGYTIPSDHHSFAVNAGVVLNLYSSANFAYDFPGQTGPSTYFDFVYTRNINERWALFAEPYFTYFLTDDATSPLDHRWAIAWHLGIRYHL